MTSLYIALQRPIEGLDPYVKGHALSAACDELEELAAELEVTTLMSFFGQDIFDLDSDDEDDEAPDNEEAEDDEAEDDDAEDEVVEAWFEASAGLKTIDALLNRLAADPKVIANSKQIVRELEEWKRVLQRAEQEGVAWHLEVDI